MNPYNLDHFHNNLLDKRQRVFELLQEASAAEQQTRLGPADGHAVEGHLHVLDDTLERVADGTLGRCQVCHGYVDDELLEIDYTATICIDHLPAEELRRLEFELELSQAVQKALLPERAPAAPGLEIAAFSRPAQLVGGDFFDFFQFHDGAFGLAIADVAGHGMSAGLLMASLQTALRTIAPTCTEPAEVLHRLNDFFLHNIRFNSFVTLFLGRLEPAAGRLSYANAGHNPPLLQRAHTNGRQPLAWLEPTGPAIGLVENGHYANETRTVAAGDVLVLYTDGVTELTDGRQQEFGSQRLAELVAQAAGLSAKELVTALRQELTRFSGDLPLADDTTIVACRFGR